MTIFVFTITHNPDTGETTYVTNVPLATAQGLLQEMALDAAVKKRIEEAAQAQAQEDAKKKKVDKGAKKAARAKDKREAAKTKRDKETKKTAENP